jgi:RNA polymerase sigma-70 factor (ECF subfamily)
VPKVFAPQPPPASGSEVLPFPIRDSDVGLVAALRAGRSDAATALFDRHGRFIQRVLARVLGPDPELPDVLHDVFVEALESLEKLHDPKCLRTWLTSIAIFSARGHIRRRKRRRIISYLPFHAVPQPAISSGVEEWSQPLLATYRTLEKMRSEDRILFALRYIEGLELTEVAAAAGVSLATAKLL